MKYLALLIFFILTHTVYSLVDLGSWSLLEPFLIMLILVYYIFENPWIYYPLALGAGLLVDGFSASFGLHTFSFLLVLFSLSTLQLTIFTSKNTGTIIFLTWLGCIIFWLKSSQTLGSFFAENKSHRLFQIFLLVLFILFSRAFYLQIIQGDSYRDRAEGNRIRHEIVRANRGLIYDRNGVQLVKNVSHFFLYLWPDHWSDETKKQETLKKLSEVLAIPQSDIEERLVEAKKGEKVLVFENVAYEQAIQLILVAENNPSIEISYEPRREYFPQFGLSHELGYLGVVSEKDLAAHKDYNYNDRLGKN